MHVFFPTGNSMNSNQNKGGGIMAEQERNLYDEEHRGALAEDWREVDRTDSFNTSGEEDNTIWDNMVNAFKPDLRRKGR
jgi:hypothetical protein